MSLIYDSKSKVNTLVEQFESVFTTDTDNTKPAVNHGPIKPLQNIIGQQGVLDLWKSVSPAKTMRPDAIPNMVLKNCVDSLALGITCLFQELIDSGHLPSDLLNANVAPIF